jgi:hypothetical protein
MLAVESAVVVVERVPDPAYCFRRREGSVERQPADSADQSEQLCAAVAVGLLRWESGGHGGGLLPSRCRRVFAALGGTALFTNDPYSLTAAIVAVLWQFADTRPPGRHSPLTTTAAIVRAGGHSSDAYYVDSTPSAGHEQRRESSSARCPNGTSNAPTTRPGPSPSIRRTTKSPQLTERYWG